MAAPKGNKFALGLTDTGRPPIYDNPEDLKNKCIEYFTKHTKYTITGLSLYLGFAHRCSLDYYTKKSDEFSYVIKRAKMVVEQGYEEMFHNGSNAGIFPLKNMGWKDKVETVNFNKDVTITKEELDKAKKDLEDLESDFI